MKGRFIQNKTTLKEHIRILDQNEKAGIRALKNLLYKMRYKLKDIGYPRVSENDDLIYEYMNLIFETQDYRCTHWLEVKDGEINSSWNAPGSDYFKWRSSFLYYEIDHVYPCNAGGKDGLENFQFLSANANRFIKCSMVYEDLLKRVDLSDRLKDRIRNVLARRKELFKSKKWKDFVKKLENYEKNI